MLALLLLTYFILACVYWHIATKRPKNFPPGPKWLPVVGNSLMLRKAIKKYGTQCAAFQAWQAEYKSNVIGLKLGNELVVVALTNPVIQEVHSHDVFNGRPDNFFVRLRSSGSRLGITCTDGDFWWEQRNFILRHLRRAGYARDPMEEQIQRELNKLTEWISGFNEKPIWPGKLFSLSVLSVLWTFTAGRQLSRDDPQLTRLMDLMRKRGEAFDVSGGWLNAMPFLRFIAPEKSAYNLITGFNAEIYEFFLPVIEEHKNKYAEDKIDDDLIYAFINEMKKTESDQSNFTDAQLIMVVQDLFIAGAHSTSYTLDFIMMMLVLYPDVQEKCHKVIDEVLGSAQLPSLKDKSNLSYVEAVIVETQRIWNVVSVGGPRRITQDTLLDGWFVPKNTTLLVGLETVNMDAEYWGDPQVFRPERFLDENNKIVNTDRLVTFAKGKRRCLGEALARACLFSFTVGVLQKFKLEIPPNGKSPNRKFRHGILRSPEPYEIVFKQR